MAISKDWLDKAYEGKSPEELLNAPVDAIQGVSEGDAKLLKEAFNIKTIKDFASCKFIVWAQELANLKNMVDKAYESKSLTEIADAPVDAIQGVSAGDAEKLKSAFNVKTVKDLADLKFVKWAQDIVSQAK